MLGGNKTYWMRPLAWRTLPSRPGVSRASYGRCVVILWGALPSFHLSNLTICLKSLVDTDAVKLEAWFTELTDQ